jgi:hypothetical protein
MYDDRLRAIWETEIDRLELDVIRAERLLKGLATMPTDPWDPPVIPGQMPADLAARAQELLDRQERATARLTAALADAQRQISYADRVTDVSGRAITAPVYLDLEA